MTNEKCDLVHPKGVKEKKMEMIDAYLKMPPSQAQAEAISHLNGTSMPKIKYNFTALGSMAYLRLFHARCCRAISCNTK